MMVVVPYSPSFIYLYLLLLLPFALGLHSSIRSRRFSSPLQSPFDFHPLLGASNSPNASGVRLRLFPRGVHTINMVASNLLASQLPRILIPNIEHRLPGDQGVINISKVRMSRFKRAAVHNISMKAPNRVLWSMEDVNIGLIGDLSGQTNIVVPLDLTGEAEILAEGLDLTIESEIKRSDKGSAKVNTLYCSSSIRAVEVINHNGGVFGLAVQVFKQGISDNVRSMLERIICKEVKRYIDEDLNMKLAEVQTKSPLTKAVQLNALRAFDTSTKESSGLSIANLFGKDFGSDFFIDYRLHENPSCGDNIIDLGSSGEISYKGLGDTPFGPVSVPLPDNENNEMIALSLSDFVLNSLFYHAYRQRKLRVFIDSTTKGASSMLKTQCSDGFCLGDLIPQLAEYYPGATLAMLFSATRSPAAIFSERNGGILSMTLAGLLGFFVDDGGRKKQIAVFNVDVIVSAQLSAVKGNHIKGSISLEKFVLTKKFGELRISKEELDDIAILSSQFIEGMINELFATGFPLPVPSVVRLDNLRLKVLHRHILLLSDFSVDEHRLSRIASAALFPFIPKSPNAPSISALLDVQPSSQTVESTARVVRGPQYPPRPGPLIQRAIPSIVYLSQRPQSFTSPIVRDTFMTRRRFLQAR